MADGVELLADRWLPRRGAVGLPTVLIRSPYGRRGLFGTAMARPWAERGFQVVIQSTRGGFGSGGEFVALRNEREDGLATVDWLIGQPWFGESMVLYGPSYLGYVQWAIADALPTQVKAMMPIVSESALTLEFLRSDGFSLETPFGWGVQVATMQRPLAMARQLLQLRKTRRALHTLPLGVADIAALGHRSDYIQDILHRDREDPFWAPIDHSDRVGDATAPVNLIGGWYDLFLPGQLRDFEVLQAADRITWLTVGPWTHMEFTAAGLGDLIDFGLALSNGKSVHQAPVRLYVTGQEIWREFERWPPDGYEVRPLYLQPAARLATEPAAESNHDNYRYDPADPTPALGGIRLRAGGCVDNADLESRSDVLVYTTDPLHREVEVIGYVNAEIWFRSSLPHADVFIRLCDVDESGRSYNVCDGLVSLTNADVISCATVQLWPTAHRFSRGHCIRIQVSSGAFPRFARNPGTGAAVAAATLLSTADQTVYHGPAHPSAILLPIARSATGVNDRPTSEGVDTNYVDM